MYLLYVIYDIVYIYIYTQYYLVGTTQLHISCCLFVNTKRHRQDQRKILTDFHLEKMRHSVSKEGWFTAKHDP